MSPTHLLYIYIIHTRTENFVNLPAINSFASYLDPPPRTLTAAIVVSRIPVGKWKTAYKQGSLGRSRSHAILGALSRHKERIRRGGCVACAALEGQFRAFNCLPPVRPRIKGFDFRLTTRCARTYTHTHMYIHIYRVRAPSVRAHLLPGRLCMCIYICTQTPWCDTRPECTVQMVPEVYTFYGAESLSKSASAWD